MANMVDNKDAENENIKLLKEISSKLSDIKDNKEDREFQLKLAQIQTDIQFLITFLFAVFATLVSFSIYVGGMYNTLPDSNPLKSSYGTANALAILALIPFAIFFAIMIGKRRRALNELES